MIRRIHAITARFINRVDKEPGRKVWYNYWDKCVRTESTLRAYLNYVHTNAAKHGYVQDPSLYEFCSYRWFVKQTSD
jgi:putative transposase